MTNNFENSCLIQVIFNLVQWCDGCIVYPVAVDTPDVVVLDRVPVISLQRTAEFELLYLTQLRKNFEISIHRTQADPRESLFHAAENLIRTGVVFSVPQLLQDDRSLLCSS